MGILSAVRAGVKQAIKTYRGEQISAAAPAPSEKKPEPFSWANASTDRRNGPFPNQLSAQQPFSREEWDFGDDYDAFIQAEQGMLQMAVQLIESCEGDGVIAGLLTTRSAGLLKLPLTIEGDEELVDELVGNDSANSKRTGTFWKMFPSSTLARIIRFGIQLGAGVGYFVQGPNDECPVLHCVEHQFLFTRRGTDGHRRLYYRTMSGEIEVTPGDGTWFVFAPRGIDRFWLYGTWRAVGKNWIAKNMADNQRWTWGQKLARGILFFTAPNSSTKEERDDVVSFMSSAITPPILAMLEGWKLENIDVQGQGFQVWKDGKTDANAEIKYALTGQEATSGGTSLGLGNGEIFADIKQSFIDENAESLAESIHYHGLAPLAERRQLVAPWATWDTTPPADKKTIAEAAKAAGDGLTSLAGGVAAVESDPTKRPRIDVAKYLQDQGVPIVQEDELVPENVVDIGGIKVVIEYPEGSIRQGKSADGSSWATLMVGAGYGEIVGTEGEDGERIDAYVGPYSRVSSAFVLEQLREDGSRDEFKVFLGFASLDHAQKTFQKLGREDLEGAWIEVPLALLRGMISGDASAIPTLPAPTEDVSDQGAENQVKPELSEDKTIAAENLDDDEPSNAEAEQLAKDMTDHKIDRCEHGRINECPKCGVERTRGVLLGEDGKPIGWKIAWKAISKKATVAAENKVFAYHIDKDAVTMHEVRKSLDLDTDPRMGDMFPSEWAEYLRAKNEEILGPEKTKISAEAPKKYSHIDFTPPKGAREEAEKALAWRREHGRGGTEVGIARARDIANGTNLSPDTVRRMKAFFDRHESGEGEGSKPGEDGYPSNWVIAWSLWGGDAGYAWARKVVRQMEAADEKSN